TTSNYSANSPRASSPRGRRCTETPISSTASKLLPGRSGTIWRRRCRGRREYDLAALVLDDRSDGSDPEAQSAIAAYGSYDEELLDQALPVYAAWLAASFMVAVPRRPDAAPALERQLQFLRRFPH